MSEITREQVEEVKATCDWIDGEARHLNGQKMGRILRLTRTFRALLDERDALLGRINGWESHCSHLVAENDALRKERAFIRAHFWRFHRSPCEWDETGATVGWDVTVGNLEPRRSRVSFTDTFATFDEALAHLMAQHDAAREGA